MDQFGLIDQLGDRFEHASGQLDTHPKIHRIACLGEIQLPGYSSQPRGPLTSWRDDDRTGLNAFSLLCLDALNATIDRDDT